MTLRSAFGIDAPIEMTSRKASAIGRFMSRASLGPQLALDARGRMPHYGARRPRAVYAIRRYLCAFLPIVRLRVVARLPRALFDAAVSKTSAVSRRQRMLQRTSCCRRSTIDLRARAREQELRRTRVEGWATPALRGRNGPVTAPCVSRFVTQGPATLPSRYPLPVPKEGLEPSHPYG